MGGYRFAWGLGSVALCLSGCATSSLDLAYNKYIYQSPGYEAPRRTEAAVFVTRLKDGREPIDFASGESFRELFPDNIWDRSIPVMVEEVLMEEIDRSAIYNGMSTGKAGIPRQKDYLVEPTLLSLHRYREAVMSGSGVGRRRTVAVASMRFRVHGPVGEGGKRPLLMDEVFQNQVQTPYSLSRPEKGVVLAGQALRNVMGQAMIKLYESNIQGVPTAAEAAGTPGSTPPKK